MNYKAAQLFHKEMGEATPDVCIRSKARVDTGLWLLRSPMWLCVVGEELVMLAVARRHYFARIPMAECSKSYYNHATGEFVVETGEDGRELQFHQFPMSPREALSLLSSFKKYQTSLSSEKPSLENLSSLNTTKQKIC